MRGEEVEEESRGEGKGNVKREGTRGKERGNHVIHERRRGEGEEERSGEGKLQGN